MRSPLSLTTPQGLATTRRLMGGISLRIGPLFDSRRLQGSRVTCWRAANRPRSRRRPDFRGGKPPTKPQGHRGARRSARRSARSHVDLDDVPPPVGGGDHVTSPCSCRSPRPGSHQGRRLGGWLEERLTGRSDSHASAQRDSVCSGLGSTNFRGLESCLTWAPKRKVVVVGLALRIVGVCFVATTSALSGLQDIHAGRARFA